MNHSLIIRIWAMSDTMMTYFVLDASTTNNIKYTPRRWGVMWCYIGRFARDLCEESGIGGEARHGVTSGASGASCETFWKQTCNTSPPQGGEFPLSISSIFSCSLLSLTPHSPIRSSDFLITWHPFVRLPLWGAPGMAGPLRPAVVSFSAR